MKNLKDALQTQEQLQDFMGTNPKNMGIVEKMQYIKEHSFWMTDEIHEMVHELPFMKPWSKKHYDCTLEELEQMLQNGKKEFIDVFTFFLNVAIALGFTEEELISEYYEKNKINIERQKTGY